MLALVQLVPLNEVNICVNLLVTLMGISQFLPQLCLGCTLLVNGLSINSLYASYKMFDLVWFYNLIKY